MVPPNVDLTFEISKRYIQERLNQAYTLQQLRQAGIIHECWISRSIRKILATLGHQFVALGHRLEHFDTAPSYQGTYDRYVNDHKEIEVT